MIELIKSLKIQILKIKKMLLLFIFLILIKSYIIQIYLKKSLFNIFLKKIFNKLTCFKFGLKIRKKIENLYNLRLFKK
jgi:hypothetical protein